MILEHAWRRLALVLALVGLGASFLFFKGLILGLDLQGGTRLVYRVDIDQAKKDKDLPENADEREVMAEMVTIIGRRIDPQGVKDPSITQAGRDRILIELPGADPDEAQQIQARIQDLGALEMRVVSYDEMYARDGISFDLQKEKQRLDDWLAKEENKALVDQDPLKAIRKFNGLAADKGGPEADATLLRWAPMFRERKGETEDGKPIWEYATHNLAHPPSTTATPSFLPLNQHEKNWFTGEDLDAKAIRPSEDQRTGEPAIAYKIKDAKAGQYADLSEKYIQKAKAVLLNGYVRLAPVFISRIYGAGQISGGFDEKEIGDLVIVLKTGSLRVVPQLESNTTIGPTLGQIAIEKGSMSIITGAILILAFMMVYYRLTGLIAIIALLVNVALVFGALAFISATLTLPGLAGIVLTIGMAVDANILIFERIREEKDRGKDLQRAIEAGFEKAMSTILDANITTFLTGLILYNVGIGPIRGFAVTLMLGIVCSVFAAVFVGKMLFHYLLKSGAVSDLTMARLFATPNLRFLKIRHITAVISLFLIVSGLYVFFWTPTNTKYGLDFTGGAAFQVALRESMTQPQLKDALDADPEFHGQFPDPQIVTLSTAALGEAGAAIGQAGGSNAFLIKLKLTPEQRREFEKAQKAAVKEKRTYAPPYIGMVRRILGDRLAYEPFSNWKPFSLDGNSYYECRLHSVEPLAISAVREQLEKLGEIKQLVAYENGAPRTEATEAKDILIEMKVSGTFKDRDRFILDRTSDLQEGLREIKLADGKKIVLSSPFPESSLIGSRAVGDLRDAAIGSILLSLLIIVMYIRVRFHEYKYGLGACAALVHDVIITLGAITLLNALGIIHAEIDLPMIAAFLTIIGYSLNDTIVVFDRIRENLELQAKLGGKETFEELVDHSVNQTLSRTVLTSVTTFLVVASLFFFNYGAGSVLEGFAFSMMIGIVVGTYSSIWVANPVVVWLTRREEGRPGKAPEEKVAKTKTAKIEEQPEPV